MIDYYLDKKLEIKAQQTILKQNSIKLMRELKDMKKTNYFNDNEVKYSISEERRQWINTLKNPNNQFNLALTLNFNNANYSNNFNLSLVQNKLNIPKLLQRIEISETFFAKLRYSLLNMSKELVFRFMFK